MTGGFARLTGPVTPAGRVAQSRVMFGPHETNLGQAALGGGRAFSPRHVAYYQRRAAGGAGRPGGGGRPGRRTGRVAMAEWLAAAGRTVTLVTPDPVAGSQLSLAGDMAGANARLQRAGVTRALRSRLRPAGQGRAVLEDTWTGERREIGCAAVVDCGHRLAETRLYDAVRARPDTGPPGPPRAGDCVAPRTAAEAVLEGRRAALDLAPWNGRSRPRPPPRRADSPPRVSRRLAAGRPRRFMSRNEDHSGRPQSQR